MPTRSRAVSCFSSVFYLACHGDHWGCVWKNRKNKPSTNRVGCKFRRPRPGSYKCSRGGNDGTAELRIDGNIIIEISPGLIIAGFPLHSSLQISWPLRGEWVLWKELLIWRGDPSQELMINDETWVKMEMACFHVFGAFGGHAFDEVSCWVAW